MRVSAATTPPPALDAPDLPSLFDPPLAAHVRAARWRVGLLLVSFAAGLALARAEPRMGPMLWLAIAAPGAVLGVLGRGRLAMAGFCVAVLALAGGWFAQRVHHRAPSAVELALLPARTPGTPAPIITIDGLVLSDPERVETDDGGLSRFLHAAPSSRFRVAVRRLHDSGAAAPADGDMIVRVDGPALPTVRAGDAVRITGAAHPVSPAMNPGQPDPLLRAAQDGLVGTLVCASSDLVEPLRAPAWGDAVLARAHASFLRFRADLRARTHATLELALRDPALTPAARSLIVGLTIGDAPAMPGDASLTRAFTRLGLLHALTISGFHLSVLAAFALSMLRLTGDRGWLEPLIVAVLIALYCLVVPPGAPILRSAMMVILILLARGLGRRYDHLTLLMWIAIALLILRPLDLWNLGFRLTFGMTALLFGLAPAFHNHLFGVRIRGVIYNRGLKHILADHISALASTCVLCSLAATPIVLFHTGLLSPISAIASIIAMPFIVAALVAAYGAFMVLLVAPFLAGPAGAILSLLARATTWVVNMLDATPYASVRVPPVSPAWTVVATLAILAFACRPRFRSLRTWGVAVALCAWLALEWSRPPLDRNVALRIDTLSVSDGTCHVLRSGRDAVLWDAGTLTSANARVSIPRAMRALGVWRVPTVVISHPDIDHFGLLPDLIEPLGVRSVLVPQRFLDAAARQPKGPESALLTILESHAIDVRVVSAGDTLSIGTCTLTLLSPQASADDVEDNEHSLVALVTPHHASRPDESPLGARDSLLLTGDIETNAISRLRDAYPDLHPLVAELPHHGSGNQASIEWIARMAPALAIQSTGPRRLNDPRWAALPEATRVLTTARHGAVWAEIRKDGSLRSGVTVDR